MYYYIDKHQALMRGVTKDPSFISIKTSVEKNHKRIRERFLTTSAVKESTHILVKLIHSFRFSLNDTYDTIRYRAKDMLPGIANALRLTTNTSYGIEFEGQFLQEGTEAILVTAESFDHNIPWTELTPVEFLYHTNTNVNFQVGTPDDANSVALVKVNLAMLAYQYFQWRMWVRSTESEQNLYHYLSKFAVYNSLKSYMDISLFNRHYFRIIGKHIPDEPKVREYPVPNIEGRVDRSNLTVIGYLYNKELPTMSVLHTVPTFFAESIFGLVEEPDIPFTRQVEWIQILHCLPYLNMGISVNLEMASTKDVRFLHNLRHDLKAFQRTRTMDKVPSTIREWGNELIDDTIMKIDAIANLTP